MDYKFMIMESKLIRYLLIGVIIITLIKQSLLTQAFVVLATTSNVNNNTSVSPGVNILPSNEESVRPYKWKNEKVTLDNYVQNNGKQMLEMDKEITDSNLTEDQIKRLNLLGKLPHPCCNAPIDTKDCLHAQAAMGLIKFLISEGWDDAKIKKELFLWYRFWWPKHYAIAAAYLELKGTDPLKVSVDNWMGENLSTIRSEQIMLQELESVK